MITIRLARATDYEAVVALYRELHPLQGKSPGQAHWESLIEYDGTTVYCADVSHSVVGVLALHILPNMTYEGRPYALVENVITTSSRRDEGVGHNLMAVAIKKAREANCYKIMLLTGKGRAATGFYEKLGFNRKEKTGMILRFD